MGQSTGRRNARTCAAHDVCFFVSYPTTASQMDEVGGEESLRTGVRRNWGVSGVIVYFVSPVAQIVRKLPVVG